MLLERQGSQRSGHRGCDLHSTGSEVSWRRKALKVLGSQGKRRNWEVIQELPVWAEQNL